MSHEDAALHDEAAAVRPLRAVHENTGDDRAMRSAVQRARKAEATFEHQQKFRSARRRSLVHAIPVQAEVAEWFANENSDRSAKANLERRRAKSGRARDCAGGRRHCRDFRVPRPSSTCTISRERRPRENFWPSRARPNRSQFEPLQTDAGALGDLFFMKHRLEHYDVPPEFADFRTLGRRVFDDDEGASRGADRGRWKSGCSFFFSRPRKIPKTAALTDFPGWRFVELEGWTGAVQQRNGVCFMAAMRGQRKRSRALSGEGKE